MRIKQTPPLTPPLGGVGSGYRTERGGTSQRGRCRLLLKIVPGRQGETPYQTGSFPVPNREFMAGKPELHGRGKINTRARKNLSSIVKGFVVSQLLYLAKVRKTKQRTKFLMIYFVKEKNCFFFLFFPHLFVPLTFSRRYLRSKVKKKKIAFSFCTFLTYSYLCSVNWFTLTGDEEGIR